MGKWICGIQSGCFAQFRLCTGIVFGIEQVEAKIAVRRRLGRVKANRVAIVSGGCVRMAELGLGDSKQVFNRGITRRSAMCLLQLD